MAGFLQLSWQIAAFGLVLAIYAHLLGRAEKLAMQVKAQVLFENEVLLCAERDLLREHLELAHLFLVRAYPKKADSIAFAYQRWQKKVHPCKDRELLKLYRIFKPARSPYAMLWPNHLLRISMQGGKDAGYL